MVTAFVEAIAQIPQRVIWKFESDQDKSKLPDNLLLMEWLPQRDILGTIGKKCLHLVADLEFFSSKFFFLSEHKNVIAFMSHCGQGGTYEAIYTATPVIACPLFANQPGNAALLEQLEVAVHFDIRSLTTDSLLQAFKVIVNDKKYVLDRDFVRFGLRESKHILIKKRKSFSGITTTCKNFLKRSRIGQ